MGNSTHTSSHPPPGSYSGPVALVIAPGMPASTVRLPAQPTRQLAVLQELVGGYVETFGGVLPPAAFGSDRAWVACVNEGGKQMQLPPNDRGGELARGLGWRPVPGDYVAGPAVFTGRLGAERVSVPGYVLDAARAAGLLAA